MIHIDTVAAAAAAAQVDVHIIIIIIIHFALCCIGECEIRKREGREKEEGCLFLWKQWKERKRENFVLSLKDEGEIASYEDTIIEVEEARERELARPSRFFYFFL